MIAFSLQSLLLIFAFTSFLCRYLITLTGIVFYFQLKGFFAPHCTCKVTQNITACQGWQSLADLLAKGP